MNKAEESSLTERQQYWLNHIHACETSGKSIADYAVKHDINVKTMYAGKKMLVKKGILPRTHSNRFQRAQLSSIAGDEWLYGSRANQDKKSGPPYCGFDGRYNT
jgi:ABC-type hemin transport system ATPase subunit